MAKVILWPGKSAGKWRAVLKMMRECWLEGKDTMCITPRFSTTRYLENLHLQWLGEMEMFRYEGGTRAYERYRRYVDDLW